MGRAFEYRKATKLKRWGNMARTFTRLGKQISIAVKEGGGDPDTNPKLRATIATAKRENMPKDNIERAIKNALGKNQKDYKEMNYEGYGPHGIAIFVETATDNTTRTVANVRAVFNKNGGTLGQTGNVDFMFKHMALFTIEKKEGVDMDELILELIDFGIEEEYDDEGDEVTIYGEFSSFNKIQHWLEDNGFEIKSSEFTRIPLNETNLTGDERAEVEKLIEKLEEDEDVQNVYSTLKPFIPEDIEENE